MKEKMKRKLMEKKKYGGKRKTKEVGVGSHQERGKEKNKRTIRKVGSQLPKDQE